MTIILSKKEKLDIKCKELDHYLDMLTSVLCLVCLTLRNRNTRERSRDRERKIHAQVSTKGYTALKEIRLIVNAIKESNT